MKNLKKEIQSGNAMFGMYIGLTDPAIVEMAAYAGYDFVRIDCEHTLFDPLTVCHMIRIANLLDLPVFIRISSMDDITRLLDAGATGIMVPHIYNRDTAQTAIDEVKYAPLGRRGMFGNGGSLQYGNKRLSDYVALANDEVFLVVQIEDKEGVDNIDDILSLDGIDMVATGKNDLSQSYGYAGQPNHPEIIAAENRVIQKALEYGKIPTLLANSKERVEELKRIGANCFMTGRDSVFVMEGMKKAIALYKG